MDLGLRDKVVLVTGGSGEIGRAIGLAVAAEGAKVAVAYHSSRAKAEALVREIEAASGSAIFQQVDLSSGASVQTAVHDITERWGTVDVLVNNAVAPNWFGFQAERAELSRWDEMLRVSLTGAFLCCAACIPYMKANHWGRIVNVSSMIALSGLEGSCHYGAAKAGLIGLTKSLARDVGRDGILVNAVAPRLVLTEVYQGAQRQSLIEKYRAENPLGRAAEPDDVARVILFLASGWNTYVNGEVVEVSGGM